MPAPLKLDKSWQRQLKHLTVQGRVLTQPPSAHAEGGLVVGAEVYGLLDQATGNLMQSVRPTAAAAQATADRINARRRQAAGTNAPLVYVVTITRT